jgi:hypothetical protein
MKEVFDEAKSIHNGTTKLTSLNKKPKKKVKKMTNKYITHVIEKEASNIAQDMKIEAKRILLERNRADAIKLTESARRMKLTPELNKQAAEKYEGDKVSVKRVAKTYGKMMDRSFVEAIPGALGGATIGAGLGALTSLGLHTNMKRAAGIGTSLGAAIGSAVGSFHGGGRSLQNSLQIEREREREHEKKSNFLTSAAKVIKEDASKLGDQVHNARSAYEANKGLFNEGTLSTLKTLGKNKAVQAGAGIAAGGYVAGRSMNKQASENKYLEIILTKRK